MKSFVYPRFVHSDYARLNRSGPSGYWKASSVDIRNIRTLKQCKVIYLLTLYYMSVASNTFWQRRCVYNYIR